jgi:hypothetical protein
MKPAFLWTMLLSVAGAHPAASQAEELILGRVHGPAVQLFASGNAAGARRAVASWKAFFAERKIATRVVPPARQPQFRSEGAVMAFETLSAAPLAARAGVDLTPLRRARDEAHLIVARQWNGLPLVLVVGTTDRGAEAGAAFLLGKVVYRGPFQNWTKTDVALPPMRAVRKPFFKIREVIQYAAARGMPMARTRWPLRNLPWLEKQVSTEKWTGEQLVRYVDYFRACGFNSVQLSETLGWPGGRDHAATRERMKAVIRTMADAAHERGMSATLYVWTIHYFKGWTDPQKRRQTRQQYAELARLYANLVDHVNTHWFDPGPGGYVVPQQATAALQAEFRKHNPKIQVTIDTWYNRTFWKGDPKARTFLDETFCPRDIGIALSGWYNAAQADLVKKSGRRLGIWGWYLSDWEMTCGSHLWRYPRLVAAFDRLPEEASEKVDWMSVEKCWHALPSDVNLYIAGRKMWEPRRPLDEILTDYLRSVYGEAHVKAVRFVYDTVAGGRIQPALKVVVKRKADALKALGLLESVKLPTWWRPNFPTMDTPHGYLMNLRSELNEIVAGAVRQEQAASAPAKSD